jgi:hypothetical protein
MMEKENQKKGEKSRGEETGGMEKNEREVLNGNKQGDDIGSRGEIVIDYEIVKEEAWVRIQNKSESRIGPSRNSFEERKGRERTEKERSGG